MFKRFRITSLFWIAGGALAGLAAGIPGVIIGIVLGYFLSELWAQLQSDRHVLEYFENPGPSRFYEGEPGLAAFCALEIFLLSKSIPRLLTGEAAMARAAGGAVSVFPQGRKIAPLAESFCRLALSRSEILNPDLLAESLAARRQRLGDLALLGAELDTMASGTEAKQEARYIRQLLDPDYAPPLPEQPPEDPWKLLGIAQGASQDEIKSAFRKLAMMFHPDNQTGLGEEKREQMGTAFMKIREAYRELTRPR